MIRLIFLMLTTGIVPAIAQVNPEKLISGQIEPAKWSKMEKSIRKALVKDSINPEARYLLSLFYFNPGHPTYQVDSSYHYVLGSWRDYRHSSIQDREKLRKIPLDSLLLLQLKIKIDSAAFERAKKLNTMEGYQYFISRFSTASQRNSAIELRDEVAFLEALKINTWSSFKKFLDQFPASHRKKEAMERYEKLLYEDRTKDRKLSSYQRFLQQFPASPYRSQAEKNIFELSTVSGSPASFQWFIEEYPSSEWASRGKNILYGLRESEGDEIFQKSWLTDSLKHVEQLNQNYWLAVFKSGLFGFMDEKGIEVMPPRFEEIDEDYLCGNIISGFLLTSSGLMGRNGSVILKEKVREAKDLGLGFILASTDSGKLILHESGFRITSQGGEDAKLLANRFIGIFKNKKWAITSLADKSLYPFLFDEIDAYDTLVILTRNGKKYITTPSRLARDAMRGESNENFVFDDVKRWTSKMYWVRNGLLEGVLDARLNYLIQPDRQILRKTTFGFVKEKDKKLFIDGIDRLENTPYRSVYEQGNWVRMQDLAGKYLLYEKTFDQLYRGDSAWFQGQISFLMSGDSISAYLPSAQKLSFHVNSVFKLIEYKDSSSWLILDEKKKKSVYDAASGLKMFSMELDQVEPLGEKIFLATRANKKGLLTEEGKVLVPVEYDAVVAAGDYAFSLLKDKKFGWYDASTKQLMKPAFERNVRPYNKHYRLAFRDKGYAFIRPDGTPLGNFEWEDFQFWNDSVAWVKKNFQWMLVSIHSQKIQMDRVRSFSPVQDTPAEKIYYVRQDNVMGIISNRKGIIVPLKYSDIVNLGSPEVPMYFTERHIEEAGISVVVYYDQHGKIVRRQAMETEEFEKIYCDN